MEWEATEGFKQRGDMIRFTISKITPVNWVEDLSWRLSTPTGAPGYRQQTQGKTSTPKYPQDLSAHIMQVCEQYK